ncbi:uncharacterized protein BO80DRAFT_403197 [Aspergillus ibericus CBS 121593]|uniref:Uncharacterized protein n=1 Tax=Aspergillus ibericus CBS 121593 TaxID=1448316 RepID=A0A395H549_9EURO|nr:hypothetical protein BO80DRAFT_403197 [Aspergillus ibericus CBS 121593]RAL02619.1 hypothetical protein BO80DRAFT_403197 [Aspergillus ibericus CBS 121593]
MLRLVDTASNHLVESLPAYSLLKTHAYEALHALHVTGSSSYIRIRNLFAEFCQPRCRTCPDFGPFLYLPSMIRCCYKCNFIRPVFELARVSDLRFRFGLSPADLKPVPILHSILQPQIRLARIKQAKDIGRRLYGTPKAMEAAYQARVQEHQEKYNRRIHQWEQTQLLGEETPRPRYRAVREKLGHERDRTTLKMHATTPFPYWDRETRTLEPGTYCRACTYHWEEKIADDWRRPETMWHIHPPGREACYRAFLEAELPEHFRECAAVKANYNLRRKKVRARDRERGRVTFIVRLDDTGVS